MQTTFLRGDRAAEIYLALPNCSLRMRFWLDFVALTIVRRLLLRRASFIVLLVIRVRPSALLCSPVGWVVAALRALLHSLHTSSSTWPGNTLISLDTYRFSTSLN